MIHSPAVTLSLESIQLEWMTGLIGMTTPAEIAQAIVGLARLHLGCEAVLVIGSGDPETFESTAPGRLHRDDLRRTRALLASVEPLSIDGRHVAVRLQQERAVLLLQFEHGQSPLLLVESIGPCLQLAGLHLQRALKLADLHHAHKQLERSETLQRALFAISDLAGSDRDMPDLLRGIHAIVGTLMYAENFFIVRHDAERDSLRFLYYADVEDTEAPDPAQDYPMRSREHTLTWYLIVDGKALMGSAEQLQRQVSGPLVAAGRDSIDWLGVPMLRNGKIHGALVVQSYREGIGFTVEDRALLEFVGSHILTALERKQSKDELEQRVRLRTVELAEANRGSAAGSAGAPARRAPAGGVVPDRAAGHRRYRRDRVLSTRACGGRRVAQRGKFLHRAALRRPAHPRISVLRRYRQAAYPVARSGAAPERVCAAPRRAVARRRGADRSSWLAKARSIRSAPAGSPCAGWAFRCALATR